MSTVDLTASSMDRDRDVGDGGRAASSATSSAHTTSHCYFLPAQDLCSVDIAPCELNHHGMLITFKRSIHGV